MRSEVLELAAIAGGMTYLWRYLPLRSRMGAGAPGGRMARFLAATGPAAIATLFVAEMLPLAQEDLPRLQASALGVLGVLAAYAWRRSVVFATLAGALACGLATALGPALPLGPG